VAWGTHRLDPHPWPYRGTARSSSKASGAPREPCGAPLVCVRPAERRGGAGRRAGLNNFQQRVRSRRIWEHHLGFHQLDGVNGTWWGNVLHERHIACANVARHAG